METHCHMRAAGLKTNKLLRFPYQESALIITTRDELGSNFTISHLPSKCRVLTTNVWVGVLLPSTRSRLWGSGEVWQLGRWWQTGWTPASIESCEWNTHTIRYIVLLPEPGIGSQFSSSCCLPFLYIRQKMWIVRQKYSICPRIKIFRYSFTLLLLKQLQRDWIPFTSMDSEVGDLLFYL